jgi:glycosyltransferase involved in cell wall biosynthesis
MVPLVENLEVLLATETLLINSHLGAGILSPLRRRLGLLRFSSLGKEDFLPIAEPSTEPSTDALLELLCVGRLAYPKRIDVAIETVGRLRRDGVEATLTIVGEGVDRPRLERLTQALGLSDVVDFVGWLDDPVRLREHFRSAFALLMPSEIEGFGMVVLEAMAAGTPVVRTAPIGGFDTLEPGVDVLVVPTGSAESFASAVKRLHTDRDSYLEIARAAQTKALSLTREAWQRSFCERADRLIRARRRAVMRSENPSRR